MNANAQTLNIKPISPAIGAIVGGIDLARTLSAFEVERLTAALVTHHVLFFEQQDISPAQLRDLAKHFGALHIHPIYPHVDGVPEIIILDTGAHNLPDNDNWHTDVTFIQTPPLGAILAARAFGAKGWQLLIHVMLPSALPDILTGVRIALGAGWSTLVAAELVAATRGLGFMIQSAAQFLVTDVVIMGILVIAAVAFLLEAGVRALERGLVPWRGKL